MQAEYLENSDLYEKVIKTHLLQAKHSIWIATANLKNLYIQRKKRYYSIVKILEDFAEKGIEIRLLSARRPSASFQKERARYKAHLADALLIKHCPRIHFKAIIIDGKILYLGSANFTGAGLGAQSEEKRNFEIGFFIKDEAIIQSVKTFFELIWKGEFCPECARKKHCPNPLGGTG